MGRPRRVMDQQGRLQCTKCKRWVHIDNFYATAKDGAIWYKINGREYVRPNPWCKDCCAEYQKARYIPVEKKVMFQELTIEEATFESLLASERFVKASPAERGDMLMELPEHERQKWPGAG